jgi:hypothetical protein
VGGGNKNCDKYKQASRAGASPTAGDITAEGNAPSSGHFHHFCTLRSIRSRFHREKRCDVLLGAQPMGPRPLERNIGLYVRNNSFLRS